MRPDSRSSDRYAGKTEPAWAAGARGGGTAERVKSWWLAGWVGEWVGGGGGALKSKGG